MVKCQAYHEEQKPPAAEWAWQPFGPDESPDCFTALGSHYRGFPVIKVCGICKSAFQSGDFVVKFSYQGFHYLAKDHKITEVHVSLWDGGTASFESCRGSGTMIMKDDLSESELIALVANPAYVPAFLAAPRLIEACEELDALYDKIQFYLERGLEAGRMDKGYYDKIMLALAGIRVTLKSARIEVEAGRAEQEE